MLDNPFGSVAIPFLRDAALFYVAVQDFPGLLPYFIRPVADHDIGANFAGDRAFSVVAHGNARHAENGGLLLQAATVGQDQLGLHVQMQKFEIAERIGEPESPY